MKKSLSLVIAVHGKVRSLEFIFAALRRQSFRDFEVIVADDGSGSEIANLIEDTRRSVFFPIKHLWHPDEGFRKNMMLNKSIRASETDYLVFIDGDCIPHGKFLQDHWDNQEPSTVLSGYRVSLSKNVSEKLSMDNIESGRFEKFRPGLLLDGLFGRASNLEDGVRITNKALRSLLARPKVRILGSNFSVEKSLLIKINGFNEDYRGPGLGEDSDVAYRLHLAGARFVSLRYLGILYHLYHPHTMVGEENLLLYRRTVEAASPLCRNGLQKLD